MKKALLLFFFFGLFTFAAHAQLGDCDNCGDAIGQYDNQKSIAYAQTPTKKNITIYPNPATNFIGLSNTEDVQEIKILNILGKEVAKFDVLKGGKYNVSDLVKGMYLVRIISNDNKIIATRRLNKR